MRTTRSPIRKVYDTKRKNLVFHGKEFTLTFTEFQALWAESGMWASRGRGIDQYCITFIDYTLPFSKDNVHITTNRMVRALSPKGQRINNNKKVVV